MRNLKRDESAREARRVSPLTNRCCRVKSHRGLRREWTIPEVEVRETLVRTPPSWYHTCDCDELAGDGSDVEMGMVMLLQISEAAIGKEKACRLAGQRIARRIKEALSLLIIQYLTRIEEAR
jgi:hypothetical protein